MWEIVFRGCFLWYLNSGKYYSLLNTFLFQYFPLFVSFQFNVMDFFLWPSVYLEFLAGAKEEKKQKWKWKNLFPLSFSSWLCRTLRLSGIWLLAETLWCGQSVILHEQQGNTKTYRLSGLCLHDGLMWPLVAVVKQDLAGICEREYQAATPHHILAQSRWTHTTYAYAHSGRLSVCFHLLSCSAGRWCRWAAGKWGWGWSWQRAPAGSSWPGGSPRSGTPGEWLTWSCVGPSPWLRLDFGGRLWGFRASGFPVNDGSDFSFSSLPCFLKTVEKVREKSGRWGCHWHFKALHLAWAPVMHLMFGVLLRPFSIRTCS